MTKDEALKIENSDFNNCTKQELFEYIVVLREALEQPAQEPVAWMYEWEDEKSVKLTFHPDSVAKTTPLYTHPHQWQGLSSNEILDIYFQANIPMG